MVTIILAVPVFLALTFPLLLTVATLGLLDLNVTTLAALLGFTFVLSVKVFPGFNTFFLALSDTLLTDFLATYTVTICFAPLTAPFFPFTVIFAVPIFLAFTIPLVLTVATLLLLELKVKFDAFDVSDILKTFFLSRGMTTFPSVVFFTRFFTVTFTFLLTFLLEADVTVIVAFPEFTALITPFGDTFTTLGALLLNVTFLDAIFGLTLATLIVFVLPLYIVTFDLTLSVIVFARGAACALIAGCAIDANTIVKHSINAIIFFVFFNLSMYIIIPHLLLLLLLLCLHM